MIEQVTVGTSTYNVPQASAVDQKALLLLLGGKIALRSAASKTEQIDTQLLVGAMLSTPEPEFDKIAKLVLGRVHLAGSETPVTIADFQGRMVEFVQLVAECVRVNLNDFFTWLDVVNAESRGSRPVQTMT